MRKIIPLSIALLIAAPNILADYSVVIPLEQNIFTEPENLTLEGSVTANKSTVNYGESFLVEWDYEKLTSIYIPNAGTFTSNSGSASVTPNRSGAFNVVVNNRSKSETTTLPMTVIFPPVDIVSFESADRGISVGDKINLSWQVDGADSVEITLLSGGNASVPSGRLPNIGTFVSNTGGLVTGDIVKYLLTAFSPDGETIKTATVEVPVRGSMTFTSFNITNPFVDSTYGGGVAIPLGGTLNTTWTGTNIKSIVLNGVDSLNPYASYTFVKSIPNPDLNSYGIPMNEIGDWTVNNVVGTGYNKFQTSPYVSMRVRVYQPSILNSFTINGLSGSEITLKKGNYPIVWTGTSPIIKYVFTGIYGDTTLPSSDRSINQFFLDVGDYRIKISAIDYNGVSASREILVHITN